MFLGGYRKRDQWHKMSWEQETWKSRESTRNYKLMLIAQLWKYIDIPKIAGFE